MTKRQEELYNFTLVDKKVLNSVAHPRQNFIKLIQRTKVPFPDLAIISEWRTEISDVIIWWHHARLSDPEWKMSKSFRFYIYVQYSLEKVRRTIRLFVIFFKLKHWFLYIFLYMPISLPPKHDVGNSLVWQKHVCTVDNRIAIVIETLQRAVGRRARFHTASILYWSHASRTCDLYVLVPAAIVKALESYSLSVYVPVKRSWIELAGDRDCPWATFITILHPKNMLDELILFMLLSQAWLWKSDKDKAEKLTSGDLEFISKLIVILRLII